MDQMPMKLFIFLHTTSSWGPAKCYEQEKVLSSIREGFIYNPNKYYVKFFLFFSFDLNGMENIDSFHVVISFHFSVLLCKTCFC